MLTIQKVTNVLKTIVPPGKASDILSLAMVSDIQVEGTTVQFRLLATDDAAQIASEARKKLSAMEECEKVTIAMAPVNQKTALDPTSTESGLSGVKNIIAVSSCKGGVGKSTIAAHLARSFQKKGFKTGLVDADIHGPSIPTLFQITKTELLPDEHNRIIPIEKDGIKLMSFGFLLGEAPAVMRGPIVTRYIQQLMLNTAWGELDYLFIDMPPGTGDVHLTITQSVKLNGAVIITTPHTLSLIDVTRGILMFEKVNVPILGIIENMSYFASPESEERHYIFGKSSGQQIQDRFGVNTLAEIPILPELSQASGAKNQTTLFDVASDKIIKLLEQSTAAQTTPIIHFDSEEIHLEWPNGEKWSVAHLELRLHSKDAYSVDEMTGEQLIKPEDIRKDLKPESITPLGNYAINVEWNDGHNAGIYTYTLIAALVKKGCGYIPNDA